MRLLVNFSFLPSALIVSTSAFLILGGPASATEAERTDPKAIDAAVAAFTGAQIGQIGGARLPADERLRLAKCKTPLQTAWHGTNRSTVRVECAGPDAWRIFIATRPAPLPSPVRTIPAVKRGDPITVVIKGRGFSVQQPGEAMETGGVGDWISVRTARRANPVRARIERPGIAIIPAN